MLHISIGRSRRHIRVCEAFDDLADTLGAPFALFRPVSSFLFVIVVQRVNADGSVVPFQS